MQGMKGALWNMYQYFKVWEEGRNEGKQEGLKDVISMYFYASEVYRKYRIQEELGEIYSKQG